MQWRRHSVDACSPDADFCKNSGSGTEKGYGYLRVYDYSDLAHPVQIGDFRTANSLGTNDSRAVTTSSTTRSSSACTRPGTATACGSMAGRATGKCCLRAGGLRLSGG